MLLLPSLAAAATLTAGSSGYSTIADAVAAASDGDTIQIEAGTWSEVLDPDGKDLTFRGKDGTTYSTYVSASGPWCAYVYGGETVTFDSITFTGCGHGIAGAYSDITVTNSVFEYGSCAYGCGLDLTAGSLTISDTVFESNTSAGYYGGSIFLEQGTELSISNSTFSGGSAGSGGEIALSNVGDVTLSGVEGSGGSATGDGGFLWM
jgi:hypothetical protein